jgi:tubulin beta
MNGEIIVIHVGQCGNQIGEKFWKALAEEHGIDPTGNYCGHDDAQQLEKINVFFDSGANGGFVPRAVFVDLEPGVLDAIRANEWAPLFHPNNFVFSHSGSGNNWAKGHYTEGQELVDSALSVIRRETEKCNNLQGFIFTHSLGGGTGSGMGTLLISKLREEYQDKVIATFSVFPSPKVSDTVVEPYNVTLSIDRLIKYADLVFCLDNEALYDICHYQQKISNPTYGNLNQIIIAALSNITAPLRFPSQGENCLSTLQDMVDKLIPVNPRELFDKGFIYCMADNPPLEDEDDSHTKLPLHFLNISFAPLTSSSDQSDLIREVFDARNILTGADPRRGLYLSAVAIFRGQTTDEMSNEFHTAITKKNRSYFAHIKGIGHENMLIKLGVPHKGVKTEVALISNTTAIQEMFKRIAEQFTIMFRRKAFLHWYTGEGMDEMEFTEAESNLSDLVTTYQTIADNLEEGSKKEEETE